jgi:hypothetical protein
MLAGPPSAAGLAARMRACLGADAAWYAALAERCARFPGERWRRLTTRKLATLIERDTGYAHAWLADEKPTVCRHILRERTGMQPLPLGLDHCQVPYWPHTAAFGRWLGVSDAGMWRLTRPSAWQRRARLGEQHYRYHLLAKRSGGWRLLEVPHPYLMPLQRRLLDAFDLAQERLQDNKRFAPRRTIEPSIVQGLVHCAGCGYALYRTSTHSSARKIYYYRCLGSDAWRYQGQARCTARPIRQDLLEDIVWREVTRLLEDPTLIEAELIRRLEAAQTAHPAKRHQDRIASELVQLQRRVERLLTAYQEELLDLDELRRRMPALRQRETRLKAELESLRDQLADQSACLRLAHTLNEFLDRLRTQAQNMDVLARQRIVRLIVKEIVVDNDSIAIRHSIPNSPRSSGGPTGEAGPGKTSPGSDTTTSSLLRTWRGRHHSTCALKAGCSRLLPVRCS